MAAARYSFEVPQGATFSRVVVWRDKDGNLVDLTGWTAAMKAVSPVDGTDVAVFTLALGGAAGTVTFSLTAAQTAALPPGGGYPYDLRMIAPGGAVAERLLEGEVHVSRGIS